MCIEEVLTAVQDKHLKPRDNNLLFETRDNTAPIGGIEYSSVY